MLDALVADLDDAGWRTPTPAAGWDVATQVAHLAWTDEVAMLAARADAEARPPGTRWCSLPSRTRTASSTRAPSRSRRDPDLLERWRTGRKELAARTLAERTARREAAVVRPADVADLDGDRAASWRRGRTASTCTRRSGSSRRSRRGSATSPTSAYAPATSPSSPTGWPCRPGVPHRPGRARRRRLDVRARGRRADGDRVGARPLPAGRPSGSTGPTPTSSRTGPDADRWLDIAQAFAGPPGEGRAAR